ncbi:hypothetical protein EDD86DRAFT_198471 [Gorgonomyces haynaldii]|nr:hypothetical protein EDD86DRAFT_198471 [Gorgonomyces haynaldii]
MEVVTIVTTSLRLYSLIQGARQDIQFNRNMVEMMCEQTQVCVELVKQMDQSNVQCLPALEYFLATIEKVHQFCQDSKDTGIFQRIFQKQKYKAECELLFRKLGLSVQMLEFSVVNQVNAQQLQHMRIQSEQQRQAIKKKVSVISNLDYQTSMNYVTLHPHLEHLKNVKDVPFERDVQQAEKLFKAGMIKEALGLYLNNLDDPLSNYRIGHIYSVEKYSILAGVSLDCNKACQHYFLAYTLGYPKALSFLAALLIKGGAHLVPNPAKGKAVLDVGIQSNDEEARKACIRLSSSATLVNA